MLELRHELSLGQLMGRGLHHGEGHPVLLALALLFVIAGVLIDANGCEDDGYPRNPWGDWDD